MQDLTDIIIGMVKSELKAAQGDQDTTQQIVSAIFQTVEQLEEIAAEEVGNAPDQLVIIDEANIEGDKAQVTMRPHQREMLDAITKKFGQGYRSVMSPEKEDEESAPAMMIGVSKEHLTDLEECARRARIFYNDILPNVSGTFVQDFANLNELGILLTKLDQDETDG